MGPAGEFTKPCQVRLWRGCRRTPDTEGGADKDQNNPTALILERSRGTPVDESEGF